MNLKNLYRRFRLWQRRSFEYKNKSKGEKRCSNCGTVFNDNFCPRCGQNANVGRINWKSVEETVMNVWGLDSRSLPNSILQLFFRPGHFVCDYIDGKRQVSFPPVNMLVVVAIVGYFVDKIAPVEYEITGEDFVGLEILQTYLKWCQDDPAWSTLLTCGFLILPTWVLFRFSPRHTRHTLPEGFFIQVFMAILMIILGYLGQLINGAFNLLVFFYYTVIYRQFFGYKLWGTIWRGILCLYNGFIIAVLAFCIVLFYNYRNVSTFCQDPVNIITITVLFIIMGIIPLLIGFWITWAEYRRRMKKKQQEQLTNNL